MILPIAMDDNTGFLKKHGKELNFLLDSSVILYFEKIYGVCGASIFAAFGEMPRTNFFVCNDVASELMTGENGYTPIQIGTFLNHMLNAETAMMPGWKENRFIVTEDGETKYVVLNKISSTDYAQIVLCQNHPELILVVNDRKMLKSGLQILPERVCGMHGMMMRLLDMYPENARLRTIHETANSIFERKHVFPQNQ